MNFKVTAPELQVEGILRSQNHKETRLEISMMTILLNLRRLNW